MRKFLLLALVLMLCMGCILSAPLDKLSDLTKQTTVVQDSDHPPFPTATVYAPPGARNDVYTNDEYGFSIAIPRGVEAADGDAGSGIFQSYVLGDNEAFGYLYPSAIAAGESLQQVGQNVYETETSWLTDIEILTDEEISLASGLSAWYTRLQGYDEEYDYTVEERLVTMVSGDRAVTLDFYSLPENFADWEDTLTEMRDSFTPLTPTVMGFPRNQVLVLEGGESSNPREYDPATTHGSGDTLIFEGLVTYNQKVEITPALAAGWQISPDGTVYTFELQPNATFHNGRPVTAQDVVYSWERAADPNTESDTVMTYLNDIVGVKEMHDGSADSISGLKILDDHTLQVTIDAPKPYFLYKLTYPTANVVDRENVESVENWHLTPNGTGPYRLTRWDSMERMLYERYEDYYGEKPAIRAVIYTLYSGDQFRLYEEGAVDIATVYDYNVERVSDPSDPLNKEMISGVTLCTSYVLFDVSKPPFDDAKVRQAFVLAFDKEKYLEVALKNTDVVARGLYPPALPGFNLDLQGYGYDPDRARQLIAESKYGSVQGMPEIIFTSSGYGSYRGSLESALSDMWQKNLGVTITVQNLDPEMIMEAEVEDDYGQISTTGWCADYPDPENFADVLFHSGAEMNDGNYSNAEVDRLLEEARVEADVNRRISLYQQAEEIIVEDAAAMFLFHYKTYEVVKPYVKGYVLSPVSTYPVFRYLSIDEDYWK